MNKIDLNPYFNLFQSVSICINLFPSIYLNLSQSISIYLNLSQSISIYLNLSQSVSIYLNLHQSVSTNLHQSISICINLLQSSSICINLKKMEINNWIKYKIEIRERLRTFALNILLLSEKIPETSRGKIINYQLTKSGTSMYANYRAALRGRSKAEFFSKLSIATEEADETEMWLELLISSKISCTELTQTLHSESLELVKILASMRKRTGS